MFNRILVALNEHELESQQDSPIFEALQSLNLATDSHLILGHVIPVNATELERGMDQHHETQQLIIDKIEQTQTTINHTFDLKSEVEVVAGEPGEEIVRLANIHHADLIVIGSRGLKGVKRVLERSVSSQVSEEASCSVLVVKSDHTH